jgi:hypothetical protein
MIIESQEYDNREGRRAPVRGEAYGDIDLIAKDDDYGTPIEFMQLNSFDSGSPPPETKVYKQSAGRASPTRNRSIYRYRGSSPPSHTANHPPPVYYNPPHPPMYGYQAFYHSTQFSNDLVPWTSPQMREYERAPPPQSHYSRDRRHDESPNSDKPDRWAATPERRKSRSPFRSPTPNQGSAKVSFLLRFFL